MEQYMVYIATALAILSLVHHAIAPRTATKLDDEAAEIVDAVKDHLPEAAPKQ